MGVVKAFKGARIFAKRAFILLILAAMGAWIAYNSTGWGRCRGISQIDIHIGLWRNCYTTNSPICSILDGWVLGKFSTFINKYFILGQPRTDMIQQMEFCT